MRKNKYMVIFAIVIFISAIMIIPKQNIINIMDYVKVEFYGSNGDGKINYTIDVNALDAALCAANNQESTTTNSTSNESGEYDLNGLLNSLSTIFTSNYSGFINTIKITPNKTEGLSNGDYVVLDVTWNNDMAKNYNLNMGAYNKIFKVSGLNYTETLEDSFSSILFSFGLYDNEVQYSDYIKYKSLEKTDYLLNSISNGGKENYMAIAPVSNEEVTLNIFSTYDVVDVKYGSDENYIGLKNDEKTYYISSKDFYKYFVDNNTNIIKKVISGVSSYLFLMNTDDIKINLVVSTIFAMISALLMSIYFLLTVKLKLNNEKIFSLPVPALVLNCSILLLNIFNPYLFYWHVNEKLFNIPTKETIFEQILIFVILVFIIVSISFEIISLIYTYKITGLLLAILFVLINLSGMISVYGCYIFTLVMFIKCVFFVDKGKKVIKEDREINSFKKLMLDDLF